MKYKKFGNTDLIVSQIGFGTWGLSGISYGQIEDNLAIQTLHTAYDLGINFYDTADVYGNGRSEELLGKAFDNCRDAIIIATKGGSLPHSGFVMPQNFTESHLEQALDKSLKRLRTDYIDIYQLHSPDLGLLDSERIGKFLQDLVRKGKIRYYGISFRTPKDALIFIENYPLDAIQINFNLIDQRAEDNGLLGRCQRKGIGAIARTPLCFGFLTGNFTGEEKFLPPDHRANWPREQIRRWAQAPKLFRHLRRKQNCTMSQLALSFCAEHPAISTTIPGMMKPSEVEENIRAVEQVSLTEEDRLVIRSIYHNNNFFDGSIQSKITAPQNLQLVKGAV